MSKIKRKNKDSELRSHNKHGCKNQILVIVVFQAAEYSYSGRDRQLSENSVRKAQAGGASWTQFPLETSHLPSFSNPLASVCLLPCIPHYTTNLSVYTKLHNKSFCVYYTSPQICPCILHCATKPSLHTAYCKKHVSEDMQYKICLVDRNQ